MYGQVVHGHIIVNNNSYTDLYKICQKGKKWCGRFYYQMFVLCDDHDNWQYRICFFAVSAGGIFYGKCLFVFLWSGVDIHITVFPTIYKGI